MKEVKSPKLKVKIEIELSRSSLTAEEAAEKLEQHLRNDYMNRGFNEFIVSLLRETQSSTWELNKIEVENG
jgi:hypothetical protein